VSEVVGVRGADACPKASTAFVRGEEVARDLQIETKT
jgi:hypothetical protein